MDSSSEAPRWKGNKINDVGFVPCDSCGWSYYKLISHAEIHGKGRPVPNACDACMSEYWCFIECEDKEFCRQQSLKTREMDRMRGTLAKMN
jgi:hypothetical protein